MQKDYDRTEVLILSGIVFLFILIFSSLYYIIAATLPKTTPNIAPASNQVKTLDLKGDAILYSRKGNESITYFDKALAIDPNDIGALVGKGLALGGLGKTSESITFYDKALAIDPNAIGALVGKGLALGRLGKYTEAVAYFDKALAIDPTYPTAVHEKEIILAAASKSAVKSKS